MYTLKQRKEIQRYFKEIKLSTQILKESGIKPDYKFYITNQIMKPVCQIYALTVENFGYNKPKDYFEKKYQSLLQTKTPEKRKTKRFEIFRGK